MQLKKRNNYIYFTRGWVDVQPKQFLVFFGIFPFCHNYVGFNAD